MYIKKIKRRNKVVSVGYRFKLTIKLTLAADMTFTFVSIVVRPDQVMKLTYDLSPSF